MHTSSAVTSTLLAPVTLTLHTRPHRKAMRDEATQLKKELKESKRRREAEKEEKEAQERGTKYRY